MPDHKHTRFTSHLRHFGYILLFFWVDLCMTIRFTSHLRHFQYILYWFNLNLAFIKFFIACDHFNLTKNMFFNTYRSGLQFWKSWNWLWWVTVVMDDCVVYCMLLYIFSVQQSNWSASERGMNPKITIALSNYSVNYRMTKNNTAQNVGGTLTIPMRYRILWQTDMTTLTLTLVRKTKYRSNLSKSTVTEKSGIITQSMEMITVYYDRVTPVLNTNEDNHIGQQL